MCQVTWEIIGSTSHRGPRFDEHRLCELGRKGGRKTKMTDSKIESAKKLLASGVPPKDVAKNLGVSIPTLYRWVPASIHLRRLAS
jgi:hypothetical protein